MAEVKNAFIKSKMNKDLDARLIPSGEYRDAVNVQISRSEGDDVGALENVLGNFEVANVDNPNLECIGYFVDEFNSIAYLFFTDNDSSSFASASTNHFIYSCDLSSPFKTMVKLVEGRFLNFSTQNPIIGVNLLEDLLFWTDNRNQPRKINVISAKTTGYYDNEDKISVAKYYPYQAIEVIKEVATDSYETTMYNVSEEYLPDGTTSNPYYEENFPGDPKYLEDKFVRFSYRFKFDDGEYSLIAPFTQPCFIPKQDGYFLDGDEKQTIASTVVEFMENKVEKIDLQIPLPFAGDQMENNLHVKEIDIIYKESDALALQVVETIPVDELGSSSVFEYSYLSQKPYKTLPSDEITRVYDKIPVKALGQEIISNRVVYANFQDKHTPPSFINYKVNASEKYETSNNSVFFPAKSRTEYPNHSLKENRNYQVGIVLSDRYGRQSTTILSNNTTDEQGGFGADTVYLPYRELSSGNDSISFAGDSIKVLFEDFIQSTQNSSTGEPGLYDATTRPLGWYSYKIVVKQLEQEYYNVYTAGAMKGSPTNTNIDLNTSFVTLINDNINKVPRDLSEVGPQDKTFRSSARLFGRVENTTNEFSNIGNAQYFPERRSFTTNAIEDLFDLFDVADQTQNENKAITDPTNPFYPFFKAESNPFIAEFITSQTIANQFGVVNAVDQQNNYLKIENLAVLETVPTVSRLDIYYETSTSGLLSDLNEAIGSDTGGAFDTLGFENNYNHNESDAPETVIVDEFQFVDVLDNVLSPTNVVLSSVVDNLGNIRTSEFEVVAGTGVDTYDLKTASSTYFYYGSDASTRESYTFTFAVTTGVSPNEITSNVITTGSLDNSNPSIDNDNTNVIQLEQGDFSVIPNLTGTNGSNNTNPDTNFYTQGISFTILSSTGNGVFEVQNNNSVVNTDSEAAGSGTFTLRVTDAAGATTDKTFNVDFGPPPPDDDFLFNYIELLDGDGAAWWFTNNTTGLEDNIPTNLGNTTTAWLVGFEAPTSTNVEDENDVCSDATPPAVFTNKTLTTGLTQGTFYIHIEGKNAYTDFLQPPAFDDAYVNVRYAIQYRANSSSSWESATDISNVVVDSVNKSGTWAYQGALVKEGLDSPFNQFDSGSGICIRVENDYTGSTSVRKGAKVWAFNAVGEYRVIVGNIQSDFGFFQTSPDCDSTITEPQREKSKAIVNFDDFNDPYDFNPDGDQVYEYRIASNNSCSSSFAATGTAYYSDIPFAKYLTQLYTDTDLTQQATLSAGTKRFRRMTARGGSSASNPEYTKDGAYTATFSSTGAVTSSISPCYY